MPSLKPIIIAFLSLLLLTACLGNQEYLVEVEQSDSTIIAKTQINTGSALINLDEVDVYLPSDAGQYPVLVFHPGGNVDKAHYSLLGKTLAESGVIMAITNHRGLFGERMTEQVVLNKVWEYLVAKNTDDNSIFANKINTEQLFVIGHSFGGVAVFFETQNKCGLPTCVGKITPPQALKGTIVFGANDKNNSLGKIDNQYPFLYLQGDIDNVRNTLVEALATYDNILNAPKMFVTFKGVNHFGINDKNYPDREIPEDEKPPQYTQEESVKLIASWIAQFINTATKNGEEAIRLLYEASNPTDPATEILVDL